MLDHRLWSDKLHVHLDLGEWQADLVVLFLRLEVTLDAVVNESDEASGDNDTEQDVRWCWGRIYELDLLGNISECLEHALVADPHRARRHPSTGSLLSSYLGRRLHLRDDVSDSSAAIVLEEMI